MTVYKKIDEGLVYPSDFFDILDMYGLTFPLNTEADVRTHIEVIITCLEAEGDTYTQTNEGNGTGNNRNQGEGLQWR